MISVLTVCGNGIGSSLMLKMKIEEICAENGIDAQVNLLILMPHKVVKRTLL